MPCVLWSIWPRTSDGGYLAMKEVAKRQGISLKYLERILPLLVDGGLTIFSCRRPRRAR